MKLKNTPARLALLSAFVLGAGAAPPVASAANPAVEYHGRFSELPVGAVQPRGWIEGWLERQAAGLTGHPENLGYPYDTCLFAGKIPPPTVPHGESWWPYEQAGYFVDAAVRLNRQIENPRIRDLATANLGYLLATSGPAQLGESRWGWPNAVVGRALLADYGATGDARYAQILTNYLTGPGPWLGRDGFVFEEALAVYGHTGDKRLLALAEAAYDRFFLSDPRSFSHVDKIRGAAPLREHGVTAAEQLKLLPLMFSYTGDPRALELANLAYRKIEADSLMPDGGMVSSESLGTAAFNSLHESCDLTDWSWSIGYLLLAGGDAHWADVIEQTTFNALPGAVTKDFRQLQYFSAANQILASSTACPRIAPTRMSYRAAHDTECCSGNINRAMPNYVARMWLKSPDGVTAALYGPSELRTIVGGQAVTVTEETDYPFRETISFRLHIARPTALALRLRIPGWCDAATVTLNGRATGLACPPGSFVALRREFRDGDTVGLKLPMRVRLESWFGGRAVSVQRGPLVYSLPIDARRVESRRDPAPIRRVLKGNDIQGFPAVEFFPTGEWRYGWDASDTPEMFSVREYPMPDNPFDAAVAPVRITARLRVLPQWASSWKSEADAVIADLKTAPHNPAELPADAALRDAGPSKTMILVPYGSTYLRLTTFPLIPHRSPP